MEIILRLKNNSGDTIGYLLRNGNEQAYLKAEDAQNLSSLITNATMLDSGEFRAKPGCHIDTIVDKKALRKSENNNQSLPDKIDKVPIANFNNAKGKSYINICKKIRACADANRIVVDKRIHSSNQGLNLHLFKLIESCGISVEEFITGYLSVLQPCFLEPFKQKSHTDKDQIWVIDPCYRVKMLIKIHKDNGGYVVVSFHESNHSGIGSIGSHLNDNDRCIVFTNKAIDTSDKTCRIQYTIQRGFLRLNVQSPAIEYYKGIAVVHYKHIREVFDDIMDGVLANIEDIYNVKTNISIKNINPLSFMSYGATATNNIYMMIDLYSKNSGKETRGLIVSLASQIINEMSPVLQSQLKEALQYKFNSNKELYSNELYRYIIGSIQ